MNKVYIIGRIARDLNIKFFGENNSPYTQFPLAVNEYNSSKKEEITNFIDIVAFGRRAELINEFFAKGNQISIEGHLRNRSYINKDNQKIYSTSVVLDSFDFIDKKKSI